MGSALAVYGGYKLAKFVQGKRSEAAMKKASDYVNSRLFNKVGESTFANGTKQFDFKDRMGNEINLRGSRNSIGKAIGRENAKTIATGRQIYKDATNTRFDRGLAKVVNAGDAVGNAAKRTASSAKNATKSALTKAKNSIADVVNPIYDYTPGATTTKSRDYGNGIKLTETVTNYYKTKRKRR